MSKLSYTGYSKKIDKEITITRTGTEQQLKSMLYNFFEPETIITICEFGNRNTRLDELELKDIFNE
jgi:hypothetical protein